MTFVTFDIETAPLELDEIKQRVEPYERKPFVEPLKPGPFDAAGVSISKSVTKQETIDKKIEEARVAHEDLLANWDLYVEACRNGHEEKENFKDFEYWSKVEEKAALSAVTGRVVAIGYHKCGDFPNAMVHSDYADVLNLPEGRNDNSEFGLLVNFWDRYERYREAGLRMVGVNTFEFDLPFIVQRSYQLDVGVPESAIERGRYWSSTFVDLMEKWNCGRGYIGLNALARIFGLRGKLTEHNGVKVSGEDFHKLLRSNPDAALAYLFCDLELTSELATRMGL